ncbi:hypothetical protein ACYQSV_000308 [Klebsiella aerogenes]|uniref:hypothetical protein n=1 Tax=Klebsiella aerogenes TaxID=548 RepID=UPI00063CC8D5|nr:hypothetical protein [Klebsiella aerogenes]KLE64274.1 hypothetical protein YA15_18820 [Klebsiella aerogenes]
MNEQANKILVELMQRAVKGVDAAMSFSQAQIPDVVHQLLVWNFAVSLILSVLGVLLFFAAQFAAWKGFKYLRREWQGDGWVEHPEIMFITLAYIATFCPLAWVSLDWLKIWLAPKIWLIEYTAELLKG